MIIENKKDELIIRLSSKELNIDEAERLIRTIRYKELVAQSTASGEESDAIAEMINQSWWDKNKQQFEK